MLILIFYNIYNTSLSYLVISYNGLFESFRNKLPTAPSFLFCELMFYVKQHDCKRWLIIYKDYKIPIQSRTISSSYARPADQTPNIYIFFLSPFFILFLNRDTHAWLAIRTKHNGYKLHQMWATQNTGVEEKKLFDYYYKPSRGHFVLDLWLVESP